MPSINLGTLSGIILPIEHFADDGFVVGEAEIVPGVANCVASWLAGGCNSHDGR